MSRTFRHEFFPLNANPVPGPRVELTVQEIEDAGLQEVLQTPGARIGSWSFLRDLLVPGDPFVFQEPLGQAREVKVALSGLFGRFVARAYLQKYFKLTTFLPLASGPIALNASRRIFIEATEDGDWPDWVACDEDFGGLTLAEAKGTHDRSGPGPALSRAWKQVQRVNVVEHGRTVPVKRIAIATRWGMAIGGPPDPRISVHDPEDEGGPISDEQMEAIFVGLLRHHMASMIARLGHTDLAKAILLQTSARDLSTERQATDDARRLLEESSVEPPMSLEEYEYHGALIGGVVTRAGPMAKEIAARLQPSQLDGLDLRPIFVGIERDVLSTVIEGKLADTKEALVMDKMHQFGRNRRDGAGGWIIPLDRSPE